MLNVQHQPLPKAELFWVHPEDAGRADAFPPSLLLEAPCQLQMLARKIPSTFATVWVFNNASGNFNQYFEGRGLFPAVIWPLPGFLQGFVCVCLVNRVWVVFHHGDFVHSQ